jgi:MFS family permease
MSEHGPRRALPRAVLALGIVSLLMDVSSEMIHALLPLFLTVGLGASVVMVGAIEGIAEATASIVKIFSGCVSDRLGRRKPLLLFGYGLAALTKPAFALAGAPVVVLAARFADRVGKGVRGAPRDALIADATDERMRGRAYGLRQGLDSLGAVIGPALALALFAQLGDARAVFWAASIPAFAAVLVLAFGVEERAQGGRGDRHPAAARSNAGRTPDPAQPDWSDFPGPGSQAQRFALRRAWDDTLRQLDGLRKLDRPYWTLVAVSAVFTLARCSEAFLILKAHDAGLPLALAPLVLIVMNLVYSLAAYPAGAWADRAPARRLLTAGIAALVAADLVLAFSDGVIMALSGVALWGAHMALTQGLFAKLVAARAAPQLRATAFGLFHCASGLALLAASLAAGLLWEGVGPQATFLAGAGFAAAAGLLLLLMRERG